MADHLVASDRVAESVAALERGDVDVAVVFSHSPAAQDPDLVTFADDRGMLASERVTPVYRRSVVELYGADLATDLDALSALLTQDALTRLDAAVASGQAPADAAAAWLATTAPAATVPARPGRALSVASVDFLESRVLGEVIAGYLRRRGYPTTVAASCPAAAPSSSTPWPTATSTSPPSTRRHCWSTSTATPERRAPTPTPPRRGWRSTST